LVIAGTLGLAAAIWIYVQFDAANSNASYRFATAERSDLNLFTIATGRIRAIDVVEVSSQLSGQVSELSADFNDQVQRGAPLARLDDKSFTAAVAEAEARLAHGTASFDAAKSTTAGATARYNQARQEHTRKKSLKKRGNISARDIDKAKADLLAAKSDLDAARAEEAVQKAAIDMARAALTKAQIDLARTVIRAPIDGVVIGRSVEMGQTVAVSMEAPKLFTIAQDLREMRVHAQVDEADIGRIQVGQNTRFSVDAHSDRAFHGEVLEIHREPQIIQNVVTYTVVISARNPDLILLPGMTAVVRIATTERPKALLVPNAALRFEPTPGAVSRSHQDGDPELPGRAGRVWVENGPGSLSAVTLGLGASDGSMTEVVAGTIDAGTQVVIGRVAADQERTLFGLRLGF